MEVVQLGYILRGVVKRLLFRKICDSPHGGRELNGNYLEAHFRVLFVNGYWQLPRDQP